MGLGPGGARKFTLLRLTATALALGGVMMAVGGGVSTGAVGAGVVLQCLRGVPVLGVLTFTLSVIAGQVLGSPTLELSSASGTTTELWRLALSAAIVVAAVAVTALPERGAGRDHRRSGRLASR